MFSEVGALRGNSWEEMWQLVLKSSKSHIGLSFFALAKKDILRNGLVVMESFEDHVVALVPLWGSTTHKSYTVTPVSLEDMSGHVLDTFDGTKAFQSRKPVTSGIQSSTIVHKWSTIVQDSLAFALLFEQSFAHASSYERC